jgi:hypothetical protein
MNCVASDGIRVGCPECSSVKCLGESEVGVEITCWNCGTSFVVERHRRRSRVSHALRTSSLLRRWQGFEVPDRKASHQTMLFLVVLLFLVIAGLYVATHLTGVADLLRSLVTHVRATA